MSEPTSRATRLRWDAVAAEYARLVPDLRTEAPVDRAVLAAFVETVAHSDAGVVVEVGCGTGRITSHLAAAGLPMVGLDVSLGMVSVARSSYPGLVLAVADARALPLRTGSLAGLVAWYSIINLAPDELPRACTEFARVMRPGAALVIAFQAGGGQRIDKAESYGLPVRMTYYRHQMDWVSECLLGAGLPVQSAERRERALDHESTPQAFLLARRS